MLKKCVNAGLISGRSSFFYTPVCSQCWLVPAGIRFPEEDRIIINLASCDPVF